MEYESQKAADNLINKQQHCYNKGTIDSASQVLNIALSGAQVFPTDHVLP